MGADRAGARPFAVEHGPPREVRWYDAAGKVMGRARLRREHQEVLA
jgi:hypothetical protein